MMPRKAALLMLLSGALVGGLSGCHRSSVADDPRHDQRTEVRREQDCANPEWKAANLGLWDNVCSGTQH